MSPVKCLIRGHNQFKSLGCPCYSYTKRHLLQFSESPRRWNRTRWGREGPGRRPGRTFSGAGRPVSTIACDLKLTLGDICQDHPVTPIPDSCQSCPSLGMQRNGTLDPTFRIPEAPGFLRGWSVSVGGCPLAERRATTHPPGSCNPKGEGIKSRGTKQPEASWEGGGNPASRLYGGRGGRAPLQPGSALQGLPVLYVAETRSQLSGLSSGSPTTAKLSSPGPQSQSENPGAPGCLLPQATGWHLGSGGQGEGSSSAIITNGGAGAWGFGVREVAPIPWLSELLGSGILVYWRSLAQSRVRSSTPR